MPLSVNLVVVGIRRAAEVFQGVQNHACGSSVAAMRCDVRRLWREDKIERDSHHAEIVPNSASYCI